MKKICMIGLSIMIISLFATLVIADVQNRTPVTYKSDVDSDYGFYRVIGLGLRPATDTEPTSTYPIMANYTNKTLEIYVGDTVIWINDADPDERLTIVSKEGLWEDAGLRWNYQKFNYTFDESGTYDVYIKEYPRLQHQKIIASPLDISPKKVPLPTNDTISTIEDSKTPNLTSETYTTPGTYTPLSTPSPADTRNMIPGFTVIMSITIIILIVYVKNRHS